MWDDKLTRAFLAAGTPQVRVPRQPVGSRRDTPGNPHRSRMVVASDVVAERLKVLPSQQAPGDDHTRR
jgi:hypothetical protein